MGDDGVGVLEGASRVEWHEVRVKENVTVGHAFSCISGIASRVTVGVTIRSSGGFPSGISIGVGVGVFVGVAYGVAVRRSEGVSGREGFGFVVMTGVSRLDECSE